MTFIKNPLLINSNTYFPNKNLISIKNIEAPLPGWEIGIPLNIFSNIFTNLHYGYDITSPESILIQFLVGYYTYGKDRLEDAIEYKEKPYESSKLDLYNKILSNREYYQLSLHFSFLVFSYFIAENSNNQLEISLPFISFLYISGEYKSYKIFLKEFKPIYIAIMWTIATIFLPCVLNDYNWNIINDYKDYLPCFLTLLATSNYADIKDLQEDKLNNIETIPVKYGKKNSNLISITALFISSILLINNPNFEKRIIINSLLELQNIGLLGILFKENLKE